MKAEDFLTNAADTISQRGKQYDKPAGERSMAKTVAAFNAITGKSLTESEGWLLMQVLKDVRQWQKPDYHHDSAVDGVSYAALKAESLFNARKKPGEDQWLNDGCRFSDTPHFGELFADTQPPVEALKILEKQIVEWHEDTFPHALPKALENKFYEEFKEFEKTYINYRLTATSTIEEFADMFIVYSAFLKRYHNWSLVNSISEKLEVNKERTWGEEDENGDRPRCK